MVVRQGLIIALVGVTVGLTTALAWRVDPSRVFACELPTTLPTPKCGTRFEIGIWDV
jgi:hypothetical protein